MARRRSVVRRAGAGRRVPPVVVVAVLVLIGVAVIIGARFGAAQGPGQGAVSAGEDAAATAGRTATLPARAGFDLFDRIGAMWNAAGRIETLEAENRDLRAWRALAERLAERNARYEALLRMPADAFGQGADIENAIAAQLVLDSGGPFSRTLLANAGADHGVRVGFVAVNEHGLVGRVVSVGRRSARVLMLDDYNSRIPVMGETSRVRAVLAGQSRQPPDLLVRPFTPDSPQLDYIVGAHNLREGERIVTSGDGGLFPRGLSVGVADLSPDGKWRVALAASQQPIDFVRLIPFVAPQAPEDAPVADAGPPASTSSAVATIVRETTPPAATRRAAPPPSAVAPAPRPAAQAPAPRPAAPAEPAPAEAAPAEAAPAPAAGGGA